MAAAGTGVDGQEFDGGGPTESTGSIGGSALWPCDGGETRKEGKR